MCQMACGRSGGDSVEALGSTAVTTRQEPGSRRRSRQVVESSERSRGVAV